MSKLCSALAMALSSTFDRWWLAAFGVNARIRRASSTCFPRISAATTRILLALTRTYRAPAVAPCLISPACLAIPFLDSPSFRANSVQPCAPRALLQSRRPFGVVPVHPERPCRCKLSQLVADHRLGDVDRHVLATVVDRNRVADHV